MENKTFLDRIEEIESTPVTKQEEDKSIEVFPNHKCKQCWGRGFIKKLESSKTPMKKDVLLKAAEKGQTFQMMRCHCLGTGNQERNKKEYLKLVGPNEKGFKVIP